MSARRQIFMIVTRWLAALTSLEVLSANVWMVTEILGLTINIDKAASASSVLPSTVTTEVNVNIKMVKKFACKCVFPKYFNLLLPPIHFKMFWELLWKSV